jgi:prevent-host-death family protein
MGSTSTPRRIPTRNSLPLEQWKLEDAKARFSEVVRRAAETGPQLITVRGREAAVILTAEQYRQLAPKPKNHVPFVRFLQKLGLDQIEPEREQDRGREIAL